MRFVHIVLLGCAACGQVTANPPDGAVAAHDFAIAVDMARVRLPDAGTVEVTVAITRNDLADPVAVTVAGLPTGVTADPLSVSGDTGKLVLRGSAGAVQGDAALVVTGAAAGKSHDAALSLLAMGPPGTLDTSFGTMGTMASPPTGRGNAILVQPDGKILVAGVTTRATRDFLVMRLMPDGSLDATFSGGVVGFDATTATETGNAVALQTDGKIVVAGSIQGAGNHGLLVRFNADGSVDSGFGMAGKVQLDLGPPGAQIQTELAAVVVQADGGIVVAGRTETAPVGASNFDAVVARLAPNGTLDTSFGTAGKTLVPLGSGSDRFAALALQADGKVVAVGAAAGGGTAFVAGFARFAADGKLDPSFSGDGKLTLDVGDANGSDFVFGASVALLPDGKILAAGGASAAGGSDACLVRLNGNDGSPDTAFGTGGIKTVSLGSGNVDFTNALAVHPDGRIVVAGGTLDGAAQNVSAFLARMKSDGQLDLGFAGDGFVVKELADTLDEIDQLQGIVIDADGRYLVSGFKFPEHAVLARFWP